MEAPGHVPNVAGSKSGTACFIIRLNTWLSAL